MKVQEIFRRLSGVSSSIIPETNERIALACFKKVSITAPATSDY